MESDGSVLQTTKLSQPLSVQICLFSPKHLLHPPTSLPLHWAQHTLTSSGPLTTAGSSTEISLPLSLCAYTYDKTLLSDVFFSPRRLFQMNYALSEVCADKLFPVLTREPSTVTQNGVGTRHCPRY